jgi:hypothetical protein
MSDIPAIAWVFIGIVLLVVMAMNVGLILVLKNPSKFKLEWRARRASRGPGAMGDFVKVLRDPFAQERGQLQELSSLVKELDQKAKQDQNREG